MPLSLAWRPDGSRVVVGGVDGSVSEWTVAPVGAPARLAGGSTPGILDVLPVPDEG